MDTNKAPHGEGRRRALLNAVVAEGDTVERHYLEAKSDIDLTTKLGIAKVAKFILGAANRKPEFAAQHFEGYAVLVIGAAKSSARGIPGGTEILTLKQKLGPYLSTNGPMWDLERLTVSDAREVLFVIVEPPERGHEAFLCHKDFQPSDRSDAKHGLHDGAIYVRGDGETRVARSADVYDLRARAKAGGPQLGLDIDVIGTPRVFTDVDKGLRFAIKHGADEYREEMNRRRMDEGQGRNLIQIPGVFPPRAPILPPNKVDAEIESWSKDLKMDWQSHVDYLARAAWPALRIRVDHPAPGFINNAEIVVTFKGVRGIDKINGVRGIELFNNVFPSVSLAGVNINDFDISHFDITNLRLRNEESRWVNVDDSLVVTFTPPPIRPRRSWLSEVEDVVLILNDAEVESVPYTWIVTADDHSEPQTGGGTLDTEIDSIREAILRFRDE